MSDVSNVTLPKDLLLEIDQYFKNEGYSSRAEFVRFAILEKLDSVKQKNKKTDIELYVRKLDEKIEKYKKENEALKKRLDKILST
jgi:Arc/MetJ-type ribon-helix-helix transcriptional regulator